MEMEALLLDLKAVKRMFSDTIFNRGRAYYIQDRVSDIAFDEGKHAWLANVSGTDSYQVEIKQLEDDELQPSCTCPAFDKYAECKHIVATMLVLIEKETKTQKVVELAKEEDMKIQRQFDVTKKLIHSFSGFVEEEEDRTIETTAQKRLQLQVEYILRISTGIGVSNKNLTLSLKVGPDRTYVVKKIGDFIKSVQQQSSVFFTQNFSYDPTEHTFAEEDLKVFDMLYDIERNAQIYHQAYTSSWYNDNAKNDRELIIPPSAATPCLEMISTRNCMASINRIHEYKDISVNNGQLPFKFQLLEEDNDHFSLDLDGLFEGTFIDHYGYYFLDGCFYKLSKAQQKIEKNLKEIMYQLEDKNYLKIAKQQIGQFMSQVVPGIKRFGELTISDSISDRISNPPLRAKLWVDRDGNKLLAKIEYHYDDHVIDPFADMEENSKETNGAIFIREAEKENKIMRVIEGASFKFNGKQLYVEDEEGIFTFLYQLLPRLDDYVEIYMTDGVEELLAAESYAPKTSIDIDDATNLLDISFSMEGIEQQEVENILKSVIEKKRFYRLKSGAFLSLENEEFEAVGELLGELDVTKRQLTGVKLQAPIFKGAQIERITAGKRHSPIKLGRSLRSLLYDIKNPEDLEIEKPEEIHAQLRDYQMTGFRWMKTLAHYKLGGILADDMGLGKTLQSITFLASEKVEGKTTDQPALIVAPASLIFNWKNEFDQFAPTLNIKVISGTQEERREFLANPNDADVWITSYPLIRQDEEFYANYTFHTLILDEAQAIKNHATKTAKAVKTIRARRRFALSGTPIENRIEELWSIFDAILPGLFPSFRLFRNLPEEKVSAISRPFILRRLKKDVVKELPEKIETVSSSELTMEQKQLYVAYLEQIQQETRATIAQEGFQRSKLKILAGLTRLRQLCCHPSLFIENYQGQSGKLEQLLEIIETSRANGKRLLIFSQFTSMLQMIQRILETARYDCFYLDGQTPGQERVNMAKRFNDGEKDIFLISLKAGGTGLNLTGADTVILYDLWWNPAVEQQAADRAHRIGQKNVVQVIRMITEGTIEEKIYRLQQKKKALIESIVQPGETMLSSLSEQDIKEILGM